MDHSNQSRGPLIRHVDHSSGTVDHSSGTWTTHQACGPLIRYVDHSSGTWTTHQARGPLPSLPLPRPPPPIHISTFRCPPGCSQWTCIRTPPTHTHTRAPQRFVARQNAVNGLAPELGLCLILPIHHVGATRTLNVVSADGGVVADLEGGGG